MLGYVIEKRKKGTSTWTRCNDLNNLCRGEKYTVRKRKAFDIAEYLNSYSIPFESAVIRVA